MLLVQGSLVSIKWSLLTLSRCTIFFCFFFPFKPPPSSSLPLYATAILLLLLLLLLILQFNSYVALCVQKPSTTTTTSSISLFSNSLYCVNQVSTTGVQSGSFSRSSGWRSYHSMSSYSYPTLLFANYTLCITECWDDGAIPTH